MKKVLTIVCADGHIFYISNVYRYFLVFTALIEAVSCRSQR